MVIGDTRPRGCGFESWHRTLDGHFVTYIVVKLYICLQKTENKEEKEIFHDFSISLIAYFLLLVVTSPFYFLW